MLLTDLFEAVEKLQTRIREHGGALRNNETLTRYALVDPLLRTLGWDTEDPAQVVPEYTSSEGRADYVLISQGQPFIIIEAKKLDSNLEDAVKQSIKYCIEKGIPYFAVTDGSRWSLYDSHKPVPLEHKKFIAFNLQEDTTAYICRQALALWQAGAETGHVTPGMQPVVEQRDCPQPPISPPPGIGDWQALASVNPIPGAKPPLQIRFPDQTKHASERRTWAALQIEIIRWLMDNGHLKPALCPLQLASRYILATQPVHPDGKAFRSSRTIGPYYTELNYSSKDIVRNARAIIEAAGQDPTQFQLLLP